MKYCINECPIQSPALIGFSMRKGKGSTIVGTHRSAAEIVAQTWDDKEPATELRERKGFAVRSPPQRREPATERKEKEETQVQTDDGGKGAETTDVTGRPPPTIRRARKTCALVGPLTTSKRATSTKCRLYAGGPTASRERHHDE